EAALVAVRSRDRDLVERGQHLLAVRDPACALDRRREHVHEVVRVHRVVGRLHDLRAVGRLHAHQLHAEAVLQVALEREEPAGTVSLPATDSGFCEKASSSAFAPSWPYDESSVISATFSFFGMTYSASRYEIPWSVGATRKTFRRFAASTRPSPPWYVTASG